MIKLVSKRNTMQVRIWTSPSPVSTALVLSSQHTEIDIVDAMTRTVDTEIKGQSRMKLLRYAPRVFVWAICVQELHEQGLYSSIPDEQTLSFVTHSCDALCAIMYYHFQLVCCFSVA